MLFACRCLNVSVEAILDRPLQDTLVSIDGDHHHHHHRDRLQSSSPDNSSFMRLVVRSDAFCKTRIEGTLTEERLSHSWTLVRCLLCKGAAYAHSRECPNEILVSTGMLHDPNAIVSVQKSQNFSDVFNILLPDAVKSSLKSIAGGCDDDATAMVVTNGGGGGGGVLHVHQLASDYLRRERDDMEERIRRFVDEENQRFDEKRTQVKAERTLLVRHLLMASTNDDCQQPQNVGAADSGGESSVNNDSTTLMDVNDSSTYSNVAIIQPGIMEQQNDGDAIGFGAKTTAWNLNAEPVDDHCDLQVGQEVLLATSAKPKRVRHSGGTGKPPKLVSQGLDSQGTTTILFTMDDFDVIYAEPQMPSDESGGEADASTIGEDVGTLLGPYKSSALKRSSAVDYDASSSSFRGGGYKVMGGASLPVNIPGMTSRIRFYETNGSGAESGAIADGDLATSIHTLALTMQEADAPERLFGERPSRYRYRSRLRHPMD